MQKMAQRLGLKKALIIVGAAFGTWALCSVAFESSRRENQTHLDRAMKIERVQSIELGSADLAQAVNHEVESLYYQGLARIRTGEAIPEGSSLLHVAEWSWDKNPSDLKILSDITQVGLDSEWTTNYLDRLGDEIVNWRGIMGSETQSLTWKSPDEKETYFTWVVPSGSAERKVRTILVKTSNLEALKNRKDAYLISNAGVLLSHSHSPENLTKTERLFHLTQRLSQVPSRAGKNASFVSGTEDGSELIVAIQSIQAIGAKLALENAWKPGVVKAEVETVFRVISFLVATFVFGLLFWFFTRFERVASETSAVVQAPELSSAKMKMEKAKAALDEAVMEAAEKAAHLKAEIKAETLPTPPAPVIETVRIAAKEAMDPMARETLQSLDDAVSDFDWSKLSQDLVAAELKPISPNPSTRHES